MKNMSIRTKLIAMAMAAMLAIMGLGLLSYIKMGELNDATRDINENWLPSVKILGEMKYAVARDRAFSLRQIVAQDDAEKERVATSKQKNTAAFNDELATYKALIASEKEGKIFESFTSAWAEYRTNMDTLEAKSDTNSAAALAEYQVNSRVKFDAAVTILDELVDLNNKGAADAFTASQQSFHSTIMLMVGIVLACCGLMGFISYVVIVSVNRGMVELLRTFSLLAHLDLRVRGKIENQDEIGKVLVQFNTTAETLGVVVSGTQEAASSVAAAAHELNSGMESISMITERQGVALQSIAASLEETSASAIEVNRKTKDSGEITIQVVNAIEVASGRVVKLRGSADRIGEVLGVIKDVSEQINLLSLNASIEAARAGDAGRGFAVVADEVKKLANTTNQQTDEISKVVKELQGSVGETSDALGTVASSLEHVRSSSESVVAAVGQQTIAVNDITHTISDFRDQMASVMMNVKEAQTASLSLSAAAEQLNRQNAQFKI